LVTDKSHEVTPQINRIYDKLMDTFRNATPTTDEIDCTLEVVELIAPLSENSVAQKAVEGRARYLLY